MSLTRLAIYRPLAILMFILGLVLMGTVAFTRLRVDRLPPLSYPFVSVNVNYPGAAPEDVETQLLGPLEDALAGISGVSGISSSAREGGGGVNLQFVEGTDTDRAARGNTKEAHRHHRRNATCEISPESGGCANRPQCLREGVRQWLTAWTR